MRDARAATMPASKSGRAGPIACPGERRGRHYGAGCPDSRANAGNRRRGPGCPSSVDMDHTGGTRQDGELCDERHEPAAADTGCEAGTSRDAPGLGGRTCSGSLPLSCWSVGRWWPSWSCPTAHHGEHPDGGRDDPRRSADDQGGHHGTGRLPPALAPTSRESGCRRARAPTARWRSLSRFSCRLRRPSSGSGQRQPPRSRGCPICSRSCIRSRVRPTVRSLPCPPPMPSTGRSTSPCSSRRPRSPCATGSAALCNAARPRPPGPRPDRAADRAAGFVVEVSGARVHNLQCPLLPVNQQLCGREDAQGWATPPVPSGQALVLVQVDLPAPGAATEGWVRRPAGWTTEALAQKSTVGRYAGSCPEGPRASLPGGGHASRPAIADRL